MATLYWISLISTKSSIIDYSERAVTTIREITSRISPKSDETSRTPLLSTTRPPHTSSTLNTPFPSAVGSLMLMTTSY